MRASVVLRCTQLDASGACASDKAAATTAPQLSTARLLAAAASLRSGCLFSLLASGQVHVWQLHLRRPAAFLVGARGSCVPAACIAVLLPSARLSMACMCARAGGVEPPAA